MAEYIMNIKYQKNHYNYLLKLWAHVSIFKIDKIKAEVHNQLWIELSMPSDSITDSMKHGSMHFTFVKVYYIYYKPFSCNVIV